MNFLDGYRCLFVCVALRGGGASARLVASTASAVLISIPGGVIFHSIRSDEIKRPLLNARLIGGVEAQAAFVEQFVRDFRQKTKKAYAVKRKPLICLVGPHGLEPWTKGL